MAKKLFLTALLVIFLVFVLTYLQGEAINYFR